MIFGYKSHVIPMSCLTVENETRRGYVARGLDTLPREESGVNAFVEIQRAVVQ